MMKTSGYIKDDKGIALVAALVIMLLLLTLGATAMMMSQLGFTAISAEKRYQIANWAAEQAVQQGLNATVNPANPNNPYNPCPASSKSDTAGTAGGSYTYSTAPVSNLCFIYGTGTIANSKVVKTVVVPRFPRSEVGALTMRNGGELAISGSSSIVNCDRCCKTPGVLYGGSLTINRGVNLLNDATCPNNPSGIYGSPHAVVDKDGDACAQGSTTCSPSAQLNDLVPVVFEATSWDNLLSRMSTIYAPPGHTLDVSALTLSPGVEITVPNVPTVDTSCQCTDAGNFTLTGSTNSCTGVTNMSGSGCTSIQFTNSANTLTINGIPSNIQNIVSAKNVLVNASIDGTLIEKNIFTTGTANITINNSAVAITNAKLISNTDIVLTNVGIISTTSSDATKRTLLAARNGSISLGTTGHIFTNITQPCTNIGAGVTCETAIYARDNITMSGDVMAINDRANLTSVQYVLIKANGNIGLQSTYKDSPVKGINYVKAEAGGNITIDGTTLKKDSLYSVNNSILVTTSNTGNIIANKGHELGVINSSTLITKNEFSLDRTAKLIYNTRVFANTISIPKGAEGISGGLLYSKSDISFTNGAGRTAIGTCDYKDKDKDDECSYPIPPNCCTTDLKAKCNPTLVIAGGNLIISDGTGTVDINGYCFTNGRIDMTNARGNFRICGGMSSNSTSLTSVIGAGGNANIRLNSCMIEDLRDDHIILRRPTCGTAGGARGPYISNTKITVY